MLARIPGSACCFLLLPVGVLARKPGPYPAFVPFGSIPPLIYLDAEERMHGFVVDLARLLSEKIGAPVEFVGVADAAGILATKVPVLIRRMAGIARRSPMKAAHVHSDPVAFDLLRDPVLAVNAQEVDTVTRRFQRPGT